ncbi:MAG: hypothetical protein HQ461_06620 [Deltaproteobacteria bacterium]|nr:hypothetical protein [Deltaproteobacteria bacterium]
MPLMRTAALFFLLLLALPGQLFAQSLDALTPAEAVRGESLAAVLQVSGVTLISDVRIADFVVSFEDRTLDGSGEIIVQLDVPLDAPLGAYTVEVDADEGPLTAPSLFSVVRRPRFASITPSELPRGARTTVVLQGDDLEALVEASVAPGGLAVTSGWASDPNRIAFTVAVGETAALGDRLLTFAEEGGAFANASLSVVAGPPAALFVDPPLLARGDTATVTLGGRNLDTLTGFDLGIGIDIADFTVTSPTRATFTATVASVALAGPRPVILRRGIERLAVPDLFAVTGADARLLSASPSALVRGTTTSVTLTGENLDLVDELLISGRVTAANLELINPTELRFDATVRDDAPLGSRDVALGTGGLFTTFTAALTVEPGPLTVYRLRPDRLEIGVQTVVAVEGLNLDGLDTFDAGTEVDATDFRAAEPTNAAVTVTVDPTALPGLASVTLAGPHGTVTLIDAITLIPRIVPPPSLFFRERVDLAATAVGAYRDGGVEIENSGTEDEVVTVGDGIGDSARLQLLDPATAAPTDSVTLPIPAGGSAIVRFRFTPIQPGSNGLVWTVSARDNEQVGTVSVVGSGVALRLAFSRETPMDYGSFPVGATTELPRLETELLGGALLRTYAIAEASLTLSKDGVAIADPTSVVAWELVNVTTTEQLFWGSTELAWSVTPEAGDYEGRLLFATDDAEAPFVPFTFRFRAASTETDTGVVEDTTGDTTAEDTGADTEADSASEDTLPGDTGAQPDAAADTSSDSAADTLPDTTPAQPSAKSDGCSTGGGGTVWLLFPLAALLIRRRRTLRSL